MCLPSSYIFFCHVQSSLEVRNFLAFKYMLMLHVFADTLMSHQLCIVDIPPCLAYFGYHFLSLNKVTLYWQLQATVSLQFLLEPGSGNSEYVIMCQFQHMYADTITRLINCVSSICRFAFPPSGFHIRDILYECISASSSLRLSLWSDRLLF